MSAADSIFDAVLKGDEGELIIDPMTISQIDADAIDQGALVAKIEVELRRRPRLRVNITDTDKGGLLVRWRELS